MKRHVLIHTTATIGHYHEDHIIVDCIFKSSIKKSFAQGLWKHAKICLSIEYKNSTSLVKESGIYIVRDDRTNMENIRFTDPFQCSDLLINNQGIVLSPFFFNLT